MNAAQMKRHIGADVKYPATKEDIIAACNGMSDQDPADKAWVEQTLPAGTYNSPKDVFQALKI